MRRRHHGHILVLTALLLAPATTHAGVIARGFDEPMDAVREPSGSILVADAGDHRIKRIAPSGAVTTVAGSGSTTEGAFGGDGGPATQARLNAPRSVSALRAAASSSRTR